MTKAAKTAASGALPAATRDFMAKVLAPLPEADSADKKIQARAQRDAADDRGIDEQAAAEHYRLCIDAEEAIVAAECTCLTDMALKLVVADDNGDMVGGHAQTELVAEAYRMTGVKRLD